MHPQPASSAVATAASCAGTASTPASNSIGLSDLAPGSTSTFFGSATNALGLQEVAVALQQRPSCGPPYVSLGRSPTITLTWPFASPTLSITLRAPKFGNSDQVETFTNVRRTAGNQLSVARGSNWPVVEVRKFDIEGLNKSQRDAILSFMRQTIGTEVGLLDHEARQWRGVIIEMPEIAQPGRGNYTCGFSFRGRLA